MQTGLKWIYVNNQKRIQDVDKDSQTFSSLWGIFFSTFLSCVCGEAVCSLSACFRIMELCHILFKVRLIRGDSEPLICCHNADVFILSVTMALLCVGLPRAHCTQAWLVNQGSDSNRESGSKTMAYVRLARVKPVVKHTLKRCYTVGDADWDGAF